MQIKTVYRVIDDNGNECKVGDRVFIKLKGMYDVCPGTIEKILTGVATFMIDDPIQKLQIKNARPDDVISIVKRE